MDRPPRQLPARPDGHRSQEARPPEDPRTAAIRRDGQDHADGPVENMRNEPNQTILDRNSLSIQNLYRIIRENVGAAGTTTMDPRPAYGTNPMSRISSAKSYAVSTSDEHLRTAIRAPNDHSVRVEASGAGFPPCWPDPQRLRPSEEPIEDRPARKWRTAEKLQQD